MRNAKETNFDLALKFQAGYTAIAIDSAEERRVELALLDIAKVLGFDLYKYDCNAGLMDRSGKVVDARMAGDPRLLIRRILATNEKAIYVLRDPWWYLQQPQMSRMLRSAAQDLERLKPSRRIVLLSKDPEIPPTLKEQTVVVEYPKPDRDEVAEILDASLLAISDEKLRAKAAANGDREKAVDAALGMSRQQIENLYCLSLAKTRRLDPVLIGDAKKQEIAKVPGFAQLDADPRGFDGVAGLENVKAWVRLRKKAFTKEAREWGLPYPKGMLYVGVPGGGKTLMCCCIATELQLPLFRLDIAATESKYVGDSAKNITEAFRIAEMAAPCVLQIDEIEKAVSGGTGSDAGDGGVAKKSLGVLLTWLQEHTAPVLVLATANDPSGLPPELCRKGRFDELFFVDLPTKIERAAILAVSLRKFKRPVDGINCDAVALATPGFSGAEIAALVPDALFEAYDDGARALATDDLLSVARNVTPLSTMAAEKITALREWSRGRARPASDEEETVDVGDARVIDL